MVQKTPTLLEPSDLCKGARKLGHVIEQDQSVLKTQHISKRVEKVKKLYDKALEGDAVAARKLAASGVDSLKESKEDVAFGMEERLRMDDESPAPIPEEAEEVKHAYEEAHRRLTQAMPQSCHDACAVHDVHPEKVRK